MVLSISILPKAPEKAVKAVNSSSHSKRQNGSNALARNATDKVWDQMPWTARSLRLWRTAVEFLCLFPLKELGVICLVIDPHAEDKRC
jgi:hypothetical protein